MKKSELQEFIREEYQRVLNEGKHGRNGYKLDNMGGGFDDSFVSIGRWDKKNIEITLGSFSGGGNKEHKFKLGKKMLEKVKLPDTKNLSDKEQSRVLQKHLKDIDDIAIKMQEEIDKGISAELAKFDKAIPGVIKKVVDKYNK